MLQNSIDWLYIFRYYTKVAENNTVQMSSYESFAVVRYFFLFVWKNQPIRMHAGLRTQTETEVTTERVTWGRTVRRPRTTESPPEPSWIACTATICAEQREELQMCGPEDTDGWPGSGWPGGAAAAPQIDADEAMEGECHFCSKQWIIDSDIMGTVLKTYL